ncbi:virulence RhuM family protein [Citrobacter portucalensis]|uniref:virulence RhuM family protein n=1 Tax=Citrobacter portucalensis TaxID=1639133 RepID=UPI001C6425F2|nr:RhuM family protein [Citrobacter portucalensis]MBW7620247.1 virulence RhuM family protein [Citrobacter portucalensis]MBW7639069.1 virulence RhuM family protein [Citrobacter portucalensis]MCA2134297.1 virulence RhuM family protein [Citrobacter portucalensis]MCA2143625.1 virulence RhuM family protein [Citrobacter portucalensis]MCA2149264.1 virulence RhuM family protein [Citrobacter portucalensis]
MSNKHLSQSPTGEFIMFASDDGSVRVECRFESDTLWLSQATICELYGKAKATISGHIKNIFEDGELEENSVVRFYRTTASDGKNYQVQYFSLPLILAVGYRVRSPRGVQFRQWATQTLQEYLIKGFVMDDERLKNPPVGSSAVPDYFDEMLERIRDIRASERRVYLRVREIFALAADYQPSLKETTQFFQTIQNKLHFACTGHTAAELIHQRADASQPHMGLTSYKGKEVRKGDVTVAKNYLTQDEVSELNRVVNMWLDFAEDQARRRQQVFLRDWQDKLDQFLQFNDRDVLQGPGKISKKMADDKAQAEYSQFAEQQRRLKEAEGEKDIVELLQWGKEGRK